MPTGPTSFPGALDAFPTVLSTTFEDDSGFEHDLIHDWEMTAIAALQTLCGIAGSAVTTTFQYRITTMEGYFASGILGTAHGGTGNSTGNAVTATKLATARNINGVSFDGSADITIATSGGGGSSFNFFA